MVVIKWTPVIVGLLLAIVLGLLFGMFISWGDILGYLIATIFVGYVVGGDYKNGVAWSTCWCGCINNYSYN